jgi:Flp pilus assembly pilin Flp
MTKMNDETSAGKPSRQRRSWLARLWRDQRGSHTIEYGVLGVVITVAISALAGPITQVMNPIMTKVKDRVVATLDEVKLGK